MSDSNTMEAVLSRFLQRDDEHHAAWQEVTRRQQDQGRLLEAMQLDLQRMSRVLEKQDGINERQISLAETSQTHGKTFDRAFSELANVQSAISAMGDRWAREFGTWKSDHEEKNHATHDHVTQARGGLKLLLLVGGIVIGLLTVIGKTAQDNLTTGLNKLEAKHDRDKGTTDVRLDALSQQVQEIRLARERDQETKKEALP